MTSVRIDWGSQSAVTGRIDLGGPRPASRREYRLSPLYSLPALPAVKVPCDHSHLGFLERSAFLSWSIRRVPPRYPARCRGL